MGLFSRSSSGNHYRRGRHGSGHYQQKGLLGNLLNIKGSRSGSGGHYYNQGNYPNQQAPMQPQPMAGHNSTTCSKCNARIPAGSKFCLQCGEKVTDALFCTNCGEKLPAGSNFCLRCGTKLNG